MNPVREAGKWLYYPKYIARAAEKIVAAFQSGATVTELSVKYDCDRRYITNLLKARGVYRYRQTDATKRVDLPKRVDAPKKPKLIRHRSERCNYSLYIAEQTPEPPKMRKCIGHCGKEFLSEHKGHRICEPCSKTVAHSLADDYSMAVG